MAMDRITVMSMNCRGLSDAKKRRDVMHYIRNKNYHIVFLQDTHLTAKSIPNFDNLWRGKSYHSCFSSRSRGTSILINTNLQHSIIAEKRSECGNFVLVACTIHNESYLFVNVYGPNEDNPTFYDNLSNIIGQFDVQYTIVAGDLNFVMEPDIDSLNYVSEHNVRAKETFIKLSYKYNIIDVWRHTHPQERKYTWLRRNPLKAGRLDMFFVSEDLLNSLSYVEIKPGYRTDHNAITLSIQRKQKRGSGLWKFNTSHLTDDAYIMKIRQCIKHTLQQYAVPLYNEELYSDYKYYESVQLTISDCLFYETLIMMIRGETIQYSKQKAKQTRIATSNLEKQIAQSENNFLASGLESDMVQLDTLKSKLEELRRPIIDGLIVRSRVAWHEEGERNTKYFLSLEKRNVNKKSIKYIEEGNDIFSESADILDKFSNVFQRKYNLNNSITPDQEFVAKHVANRLNAEEKTKLDADITMSELTNALTSMKKGKTPGSNGFPVEFFRCFWSEIGPFLHRAVLASFQKGYRLPTHREGIITLIPKKGKSPHTFKGWRPITLLNTDYKIVSTVISNRLKTIMSKLVNSAQTAYTSGRYIGENTRLVYDLIHWTKNNKKPGMILAADFEAAFESVAWNYLQSVINEMNFGPNLKHMLNYLYFNTENHSRILLNGHLGKKIHLQRGVRQGDPASGYLFNLAVSILGEQISSSTSLTGVKIDHNCEIRISQYADDTILFLDGSERSITGSIEELTTFGRQSGLNINIEKTACMAIGTLEENEVSTSYSIKIVKELSILGILIDRDAANITDRNIQLKMPKIKKEIEQWKRRCLTPIGRISIVKALLLSKLVHLFTVLPNPSTQCIKELEMLLFGFVWGQKNDKIKRSKLIQPPSKDGLNMVHIESFIKSMKLTWLKRLCTSDSKWTVFAALEIPNMWLLLTFGNKKIRLLRSKVINPFYVDVLDALLQFNKEYNPSDKEIITDSIWFSDWTKYETTKVSRWDDKGLRFIGDLYNVDTGLIYSQQDLSTIYGIQMTFLCYTALVRSLPEKLQRQVDRAYIKKPSIPYKINLVLNSKKFSRTAYKVFVENMSPNYNASNDRLRIKWIADIGEYTSGTVLKVIKATMSTYLIYFHFRIINRIYATNKYLFNIKIIKHNTCTFCEDAPETIVHLFWQCPITQIFIKEILSHLKLEYKINININAENWFLLLDLSHIEVLIITLIKAYIHKSRLKSSKPLVQVMMQNIKFEVTKEYNVAKTKNRVDMFERRWGELKKLLI